MATKAGLAQPARASFARHPNPGGRILSKSFCGQIIVAAAHYGRASARRFMARLGLESLWPPAADGVRAPRRSPGQFQMKTPSRISFSATYVAIGARPALRWSPQTFIDPRVANEPFVVDMRNGYPIDSTDHYMLWSSTLASFPPTKSR